MNHLHIIHTYYIFYMHIYLPPLSGTAARMAETGLGTTRPAAQGARGTPRAEVIPRGGYGGGCGTSACMPLATPSIKVNAVRAHGGETVEVRLVGNNYDDAAAEAKRLEFEEGLAMIHPFDDEHVIAGQGTIGTFRHRSWTAM